MDTDAVIDLNSIGWDDKQGRRIREFVSSSFDSYVSGLYKISEILEKYSNCSIQIDRILNIEIKTTDV